MFKKIVAGIVVFSMVCTSCMVSFADEAVTTSAIPLEKNAEGDMDYAISFTTDGTVVEEGYSYSFTVKRYGDLSESTSVTLASIDVASSYGDDYEIYVPNAKTKTFDTDGTLIELAADSDKQNELNDEAGEVLDAADAIVQENTGATLEEIGDGVVDSAKGEVTGDQSEEVQTSASVSTLAALKESQTGLPTRVTGSSEYSNDITNEFISQADLTAELLDHSSQTVIDFAPDVDEVTVYVTIKKDGESEGDEIFQLYLINAVAPFMVGSVGSMQFTVYDSDPVIAPEISFDSEEYTADEDSVTVRLVKSKASYAACQARIQSYEVGSAVGGTDFGNVDSEVSFVPFGDEISIDIPIKRSSVEQYFEIGLYDIQGAEYGENRRVKVIIPPKGATSSKSQATSDEVSQTESAESSITINGQKYSIKDGYLYDNYNNKVGQWFRTDSSVTTQNGTTGEVPNSNKHQVHDDKFYMYWNSYRSRNKGNVWVKGIYNNVPTTSFDNIYVKWSGNSVDGPINANAEFWFDNGSSTSTSLEKKKNFDEVVSVKAPSLDSASSSKLNAKFSISRGGWDKLALCVYGFAAMYQQFNFSVDDPDQMAFRNADGSERKEYPAKSSIGVGQDKRFFGQTLSIINDKNSEGHYYGTLDKYVISIKGPNAESYGSFDYTLEAGETGIEIDSDFSAKVKAKIGDKFSGHFSDYTLRVKPVFKYVDVSVMITDPLQGSGAFTDSALATGGYVFHRGDKLSMKAVSTNNKYVVNGYVLRSRVNAMDTKAYEATAYNNDDLVLENGYYSLCPSLTDNLNCIRVKLSSKALGKVKILNTVPAEALTPSLANAYIINTSEGSTDGDISYETVPVAGKVYTVQALPIATPPAGKAYKLKFSRNGDNTKVSGCSYDFVASNITDANIITIDLETVDASSVKDFSITGSVSISGKSIRESEIAYKDEAVSGMLINAGGVPNKVAGKQIVSRASAVSDDQGKYATTSVKACDGDYVSVRTYSDTLDQVTYVKVVSAGANAKKITDTVTSAEVDGYSQNAGVTVMPLRSATSPYVTRVGYDIPGIGDYSNSVKIVDEDFTVFADVEPNGRTVEKAIFTIVHKTGAIEEYEATALESDKKRYQVKIGTLSAKFKDGDKLYVSLVDSEKRVYTTSGLDADGKETTETVSEDIKYQRVFTGITFYLPALAMPQKELDGEITDTKIDIPILGSTIPKYKSGEGSFEKVDLSTSEYSSYCYRFLAAAGDKDSNKDGLDGWKKYNESLRTKMTDYDNNVNNVKNDYTASVAGQVMGGQTKADYLASHPGMDAAAVDAAYDAETKKMYKNKAKKDSLSDNFSKVEWSFNVAVMVDVYFVYVTDESSPSLEEKANGSYRYAGIAFGLAADASVQKAFYTVFYGVPVYLTIGGNAKFAITFGGFQGDLSTSYDDKDFKAMTNLNRLANGFCYLNAQFGINAGVGAGICGVIGARGTINIQYSPSRVWDSGATVVASGGTPDLQNWAAALVIKGGITLDCVITSIEIPIATGTWKYGNNQVNVLEASDGDEEPVIKSISAGTSDLSTFGKCEVRSDQYEVTGDRVEDGIVEDLEEAVSTYSVILDDSAEHTRPQVFSFDDGEIGVFFLAGRKYGDKTVNKLYFSKRDIRGNWSEPIIVYDNGDEDSTPSVVRSGEKCLVSWVDVPLADGNDFATTQKRLSDADIDYVEYDHSSNSFGEVQVLENDDYMNTNPIFGYDESGVHFVFYEKRDTMQATKTEDLLDVNATYQTMVYRPFKDGVWGAEQLLDLSNDKVKDPLINDFDAICGTINGRSMAALTYSIDDSGKVGEDDTDRNVYLKLFDLESGVAFAPIPITTGNGEEADVLPHLIKYNGDLLITWVHAGSTLETVDLTKELGDMAYIDPSGTIVANMQTRALRGDSDWYIVPQSETDLDDEEYEASILGQLAKGNLVTNSVLFYYDGDEELKANLSSYEMYNYKDEELYVSWEDDAIDGTGKEVYASVYEIYDNDSDELLNYDEYAVSDWSAPVQITKCDKQIDEASIGFDNDGDLITIATAFDQITAEDGTISETNYQLVGFDFMSAKELNILDDSVNFTTYPIAGEENNFTFEVSNEGLRRVNSYTVRAFYFRNGLNEYELFKQTITDSPIGAGAKKQFSVNWTVPEDYVPQSVFVGFTPLDEGDAFYGTEFDTSFLVPRAAKLETSNLSANVEYNSYVFLDGTITNNGNKASDDVNVLVYHHNSTDEARESLDEYYSKPIMTINIGELEAGEDYDIVDNHIWLSGTDFSELGEASIDFVVMNGETEVESDTLLISTNEIYEIGNNVTDVIELKPGEEFTLESKVYPANAIDKTIEYASMDPSVANVSDDGVITAVGDGWAVILTYSPTTYVNNSVAVKVSSSRNRGKGLSGGGGSGTASAKAEATGDQDSSKSEVTGDQRDVLFKWLMEPFKITDVSGMLLKLKALK